MNTLAIIPARGGSKGIPGKNLRPLAGRPLLAHTITQATAASLVSRVVVSTDDEAIAAVARAYGADLVRRPEAISGDTASSESALLDALGQLERDEGYRPDLIVFLQCTSPLRQPGDIDGAITALLDGGADSLLSVVPSHRFLWRRAEGGAEPVNYDYRQRPRRQDRAPEYWENGSIYVLRPWVLREHNNRLGGRIALYEMPEWSGVDIDSPEDFALCEWVLAQR
jgi:N-acylneuraminate cytidylyltransferase